MQSNSIDYFISGAGALTDKTVSTSSKASTKWYGVGYSSVAVGSVSSTQLTISYYNLEGSEIYSFQKEKTAVSYWKIHDKETNFTEFNYSMSEFNYSYNFSYSVDVGPPSVYQTDARKNDESVESVVSLSEIDCFLAFLGCVCAMSLIVVVFNKLANTSSSSSNPGSGSVSGNQFELIKREEQNV